MTQDGMKRMTKSTKVRLGAVLLIGLAAVGGCGSGQAPTLGVTAQALTAPTDMKYPWKSGTTQTCTQGQNTCSTGGSHCAQPDTYAWDFGLPFGTDVYAVKSGTVKNIYWGSQPGQYCYSAPCDSNCMNYFNGIYVTHNDGSGTMGIYIHLSGTAPLKADHATAWKIGDPVNQGDVIGQSGESGWTCNNAGNGPGPHLHFQVGADSMTYSNSIAGASFYESVPNPVAGNVLTSTNGGNATVNVQVYTGAGTVTVWRNNALPESTTSSRVFYFNIGDTYTFQATPNSGYTFAKFCYDATCSLSTTSNPFSGTINSSSGSLLAYFNACESNARTCSLMSNLAGAQVCGSGWTNNCGQDVTCHCSTSSTQTCDNTPGSPTEGTCVNRSGALYGFYDAYAGCIPNCSGKNCGDDGCGGYCGSGTGSCPAGYVCSGGNCMIPPPTCPTGTCNTSNATGWCGAGYYCNTSGIANGAANTLYYCSAAGGLATSPRYCNEECHFEPGLNDQCWEDTSSCSYWSNYYVYACGWDYVNGNPRINYSCYYGSKSIQQWCAPGRCAWGSVNDYCY